MKQFSHSSLSTFRDCPRKFFYAKIARIRMDDVPEQIYTFLGSRFHEAMEYLYATGMSGSFPSLEAVLSRFDTLWSSSWEDSIQLPDDGSTGRDWQDIGAQCIRQWNSQIAETGTGVPHDPAGEQVHWRPTQKPGHE